MRKTIIIINGRGGVGKDALISGISRIEFPRRIGVMNVSSIDPVKKLAKEAGWNGTKDERSRKFLSDLKKLCTEYNNLPQKHCEAKVFEFLASDKDVMFTG